MAAPRVDDCGGLRVDAGAALYWTLSAFASYTVFPPTTVRTDSVFGNSAGGTLKISCDSTARSANFPGSRLPLSFSANSA